MINKSDRVGIITLPAGCWIVVLKDADVADDPGVEYHYEDEAEARAALVDIATEDVPADRYDVVQNEVACTEAFSLCGTQFIYHGDYEEAHFDSPETAEEQMRYARLVQVSPGRWTCEEKNCVACMEEINEVSAEILAGAAPEVDGQQGLPGLGGDQ